MSLTRKTTSSILTSLTQSHRKHQQKTRINLELLTKSTMLFLLTQLEKVNGALEDDSSTIATDIYHTITNTWYRIIYPTHPAFSYMTSRLSTNCDSMIAALPTDFNFTLAATPQCTWMGQPSGAEVDLLIEKGKEFSSLFADCFNSKVMQPICDDYNAQQHPPSKTDNFDITILFILMPFVFLVCLISVLCCIFGRKKQNTLLASNYHHLHDRNSSNCGSSLAELCISPLRSWLANHTTIVSIQNDSSSINPSEVSWRLSKNPV